MFVCLRLISGKYLGLVFWWKMFCKPFCLDFFFDLQRTVTAWEGMIWSWLPSDWEEMNRELPEVPEKKTHHIRMLSFPAFGIWSLKSIPFYF